MGDIWFNFGLVNRLKRITIPPQGLALVVYLIVNIGGSGKYERERIQGYPVAGILEVKYLPEPQAFPTLPPGSFSQGTSLRFLLKGTEVDGLAAPKGGLEESISK